MEPKEEQLYLLMKEELESLTQKEEATILENMKETKEKAIANIQLEVEKEIASIYQKKVVEINNQVSGMLYQNNESRKKELIITRETYTKEIFEEAKRQLRLFAATKEYQTWMEEKFKETIQNYQFEKAIVYVSRKDKAVLSEFSFDLEIEVVDNISIGGFIIEDTNLGIRIDESLESILYNQKDWFYETSKLMIK